VVSALGRLVRERAIGEEVVEAAEARLAQLVDAGHLVVEVEPVKAAAVRLLRVHPLRAFDALQLGAAVRWAEGQPAARHFHTFDQRLALAARRGGFTVPE
jgi:predicted nucleic acid-binding protein